MTSSLCSAQLPLEPILSIWDFSGLKSQAIKTEFNIDVELWYHFDQSSTPTADKLVGIVEDGFPSTTASYELASHV